MKTIAKLLVAVVALPILVSFNQIPVKKKFSVISIFHNNSSQTVPYVSITDSNGSDSDTNIASSTSINLTLFSISGTVEITVQVPANHSRGSILVKRGNVTFLLSISKQRKLQYYI